MTADHTYGMTPRGHTNTMRKIQLEPSDELADACARWLSGKFSTFYEGKGGDRYDEACNMLQGISASQQQIHALAFNPRLQLMENSRGIGYFMSAAYTTCTTDPLIIHDIDSSDFDGVGFRHDRILVNTGKAGRKFGSESTGLTLNLSTVGGKLGAYAKGIVINEGEAGQELGEYASIVVDLNDTQVYSKEHRTDKRDARAYLGSKPQSFKDRINGIRKGHIDAYGPSFMFNFTMINHLSVLNILSIPFTMGELYDDLVCHPGRKLPTRAGFYSWLFHGQDHPKLRDFAREIAQIARKDPSELHRYGDVRSLCKMVEEMVNP
jgi:hypothetical protein